MFTFPSRNNRVRARASKEGVDKQSVNPKNANPTARLLFFPCRGVYPAGSALGTEIGMVRTGQEYMKKSDQSLGTRVCPYVDIVLPTEIGWPGGPCGGGRHGDLPLLLGLGFARDVQDHVLDFGPRSFGWIRVEELPQKT